MPLTSQGQYWSLSPNPDTHRNTQRGQESKANNLENGAQRQSTNAVEPCLLPHQPPGAKREPRDSTSGLLLSPTPTNGSCLFLGVRACLALVPSFSFLRWGSFPHKSFYYDPSQPETSGTDSAPLRAKVERTGEDGAGLRCPGLTLHHLLTLQSAHAYQEGALDPSARQSSGSHRQG